LNTLKIEYGSKSFIEFKNPLFRRGNKGDVKYFEKPPVSLLFKGGFWEIF